MAVRWVIGMLVASSVACSDGSAPQGDSPVAGTWSYDGEQDSPQATVLHGSLSWAAVAAGGFEGTFSIMEQLPNGGFTTLSGATAGQILSDSVADFDLIVSGTPRRHLGILRGDSISGGWVVQAAGATASGRFVLRREP